MLCSLRKLANCLFNRSDQLMEPNETKLPTNMPKIVPQSRRDMRSLAFHFLYAIDRFNYTIPLEEIVKNFREGFNIEIEDDSLAVTMAKGTIKERESLEQKIKPLLHHWRLERLGCSTRLILNLALWELEQPDAIPSIVINEAIELAKSFAEKDAYKFVNGILDEAAKKQTKEKKGNIDEQNEQNKKDREAETNQE